ncbi:MAG: PorV/PorQ family protein [Saprospiraceae bacterium]|nr:PorV/PorQ family protein [Saprospiraceae bacterium]
MRIYLIIIAVSFGNSLIKGQAPKFSNDFLNIGIGARGMAMAGAVSSNTTTIQAAYWNPASMPFNPSGFQVSAQHAEWFSGIGSYDYISFGKSLDNEFKSYGSISLIRMAIDKIPNTLRLRAPDGSIDYSKIEEFSVSDYAFLLSYGRKLSNPNWSFGINAKMIHRNFGSFANAWGFGFDAAVYYNRNNFSMALMGRDITTTFNAYKFSFTNEEKAILQQTNNNIPVRSVEYTLPKLVSGFSYRFNFSKSFQLLSSADLQFSSDGREAALISTQKFVVDPSIAWELAYLNKIFLRFGFGNFQNVLKDDEPNRRDFSFEPSAGIGLHLGKITLDYAMTNVANSGVGLYSHFISLNLDF